MKCEYVDHMGSDNSVANAARISMDKDASNYTDKQNASLIKYLASGMKASDRKLLLVVMEESMSTGAAKNLIHEISNISKHFTPFTHTAITLRMSAPIPIRTQCFKHKIGMSENEESRRYIKSRPEVHIPEYFRSVAKDIKQGSDGKHPNSEYWLNEYVFTVHQAIGAYEEMIFAGVCPEQARFILPQGCIVNWIWTGNLFAFANFYLKRSDPHAQREIRELAELVKQVVQPLYPVSWSALCDY